VSHGYKLYVLNLEKSIFLSQLFVTSNELQEPKRRAAIKKTIVRFFMDYNVDFVHANIQYETYQLYLIEKSGFLCTKA